MIATLEPAVARDVVPVHMRRTHARFSSVLLVLCSLAVAALGGCGKLLGPKASRPVPSYPDGPAGLEAFFRDVLTAAKADERERVHDYFATLKMTPEELRRLFGDRATQLEKPYEDMMASLIHRGAVEIVAVIYEKKYDTVEVIPSSPSEPPLGPALGTALVQRPPLYAVRLKKAGETLGTRYDFFFYSDGRWRTGNQLAKVITKQLASEKPAAPPAAAPAGR
jgi:hypothetical protein